MGFSEFKQRFGGVAFVLVVLLAATAVAALVVGLDARDPAFSANQGQQLATVERGDLVVRQPYEGRIDSRNVISVASRIQGQATVVELVAEGSQVAPGDLLVRFDGAEIEADLTRQRTDLTLRSAELRKLRDGDHPMALRKLRGQIAEQRRALSNEQAYLADSVELANEQLLSEAEVKEQKAKVDATARRIQGLEADLAVTEETLHPIAIERAKASYDAARMTLDRAERRLAGVEVRATTAGVVAYRQLHLDGTYRSVRVGDSVYANQPLMQVLDFFDLVVHITIPESEVSAVHEGNLVLVHPTAYKDIAIDGVVEHVSGLAQTLPNKPSWQRYFRATLSISDQHPLLRPGMSAVNQVITHHETGVLLIPRRAVRFVDGQPLASVVTRNGVELRDLVLGARGERQFAVVEGVQAGERVVLQ